VREAVAEGLLVKGGGHAMAAGVTLRKNGLAAFRAFMEEKLADAVEIARRDDALRIDGAVSAQGASLDLYNMISRAAPFGAGNSEPVLALPSHTLTYAEPVGQAHVRVRFAAGGSSLNGIAFRAVGHKLGDALFAARGQNVHVAGSLTVDRWQGAERVQFRVSDVAMPMAI
jgi:single-stranded-DNA-specific exonuclease